MYSVMGRPLLTWAAFIVYVAVIITVIFFIMQSTPSTAVIPNQAPANQFSAERVYEDLKSFAQKPRHPGTEYHEEAKNYIINTIRMMDIPVMIESSTVMHEGKELPIQNIVATVEGSEPGKTTMMMAHYDSVEEGPGVNDDAVNVGVILEVMRVLKQEKQLKNTITFLITDGEEAGLYGAMEYVKKHTMDNIGVVVNLEARGFKGPILLYQTIGPSGKAIQLFNEHVESPYAFSFLSDLYTILPHDTDLTAFNNNGVIGLNLAYIEGAGVYHTQKDDLNHVDLPTVQNMGEHAVSIIKAFGAYDLTTLSNEEDQAFFNLVGKKLIVYPVSWNYALTAIALLLGAAAVLYGINKKIVHLRKSIRWSLFVVTCTILLYIFGTFFYIAFSIYEFQGIAGALLIFLAIAAILICLMIWVLKKLKTMTRMKRLAKGLSVIDIIVGAMLIMAILTVMTTFFLPGSHYLTAIPLALCSISLLGYLLLSRFVLASMILSILTAVPLTLLLYPALRLLFIGFGVQGSHYLLIILCLFVPLAIPAFMNLEAKPLESNANNIN
ncbi:M28 family peptidase [Bacillus sp. FJAT-28004]|uniref:M28 family peptidase n=1 Tax=Bacillus sp. FJAT-28004 TaxID=1679165 RepID=UPI0006B54F03|nr:M28 family peptidase [Bacillus sp. FJAT-28004]